jgi:hypothetical protein
MTTVNPRSLAEASGFLPPPEAFRREVFVGDSKVPQGVCSFVLSLALAITDLRDTAIAFSLLAKANPGTDASPAAILEWNGLFGHVMRLHVPTIHEFFELLEGNPKAINAPAFQEILSHLDPKIVDSWSTLCDIANRRRATDPEFRLLHRVRNKIGFHYDPAEIFSGYKRAFWEMDSDSPPLLSLGTSTFTSRFFFSDAAATGYFVASWTPVSEPSKRSSRI